VPRITNTTLHSGLFSPSFPSFSFSCCKNSHITFVALRKRVRCMEVAGGGLLMGLNVCEWDELAGREEEDGEEEKVGEDWCLFFRERLLRRARIPRGR
jgi:hypothetical protein